MNFVMEMRPGRHAGHADIADDLSLAHPRALMQSARKGAQMAVSRGILLVVRELDVVAVAGRSAGKTDDPIAGGIHRGAGRRAEIDPAMHPAVAEDRVEPHPEARG